MKKTQEKNAMLLHFGKEESAQNCIEKIASDTLLSAQNIIIDLSQHTHFSLQEIDLFVAISNQFRVDYQRSFVLIITHLSYDELSEELVICPTLQEAFDIIELEDIERDLGL